MPINFNKFSNHSENNNENYDLIVFGQFAEVLEVELNELQTIFNSKFINKFITEGNGTLVNLLNHVNLQVSSGGNWSNIDLGTGYVNPSNSYRLVAKDDIPLLVNGMVFRVPTGATISTSTAQATTPTKAIVAFNELISNLYLNYTIKDITDGYDVKKYGWVGEGSESVSSEIVDTREGEETSRRRIVIFNLTRITPDTTNFSKSELLMTDYRYISSNDSQRYIIDNLLDAINDIANIKINYVKISEFDLYLREATVSSKGVVRYASDDEIARLSGDGVVRAKQLKNGLSSADVINLIYPVGTIYITVNDINPSSLFAGTTWERLPLGYYLTNGTKNSREPKYVVDDNNSTVLQKHNLPPVKLSGSGSTSHNGSHNHQVDNHAHYIPEHKHIVPWGENWYNNNVRHYPWGSPLRETNSFANGRPTNFVGIGSASTDFDNEWAFTSPVGLWSHGSAPWTNHSGGHSHSFSFETEQLGNGNPVDVNLRSISVILWKRVR